MTNTTNDKRREYLESRLTEIDLETSTCNIQRNGSIDEVERLRLGRKIDNLFVDREDIDNQLKQLERSHNPYTSYENDWNQRIHHLDLEQATKIFNDIFKKFEHKEVAFIFLLKNSGDMGGDWCINKLKESFKAKTSSIPRPIEFRRGDVLDQNSFLIRLGGHLGFSNISVVNSEEHTNQIIDKIIKSIVVGSINFLELNFYSRALQKGFLEWLINIFWHKLVGRLEMIAEEKPLFKFIGIVNIKDSPNDEAISDLLLDLPCYTNQEPYCCKLLELPLENWTEIEIRNWLIIHSGLMLEPINLNINEVNKIANYIHADSDKGKPKLAFKSLLEELEIITKNLAF